MINGMQRLGGMDNYLVDRLVMGGDSANVVLAAATKTGKTTLCLSMAMCMAQGKPVWGRLAVPRPLKVVFIDQEGFAEEIALKYKDIAVVYGEPEDGMLNLMYGEKEPFNIENESSLEYLMGKLLEVGPDFVFLDGWHWFVNFKSSDKEVVAEALRWWRRVREEVGCGTWIVHHTKKMGPQQTMPRDVLEMSSGVHTLMDQARTALIWEHLPGYEGFGRLHGKCSRADWDPVNIVLDYDFGTQSHAMLDDEDIRCLFDRDTLRLIYGEDANVASCTRLLNRLNARGYRDADIARHLGIGRAQVSKCRSRTKALSDKRINQLEEWLKGLESGRVTKG